MRTPTVEQKAILDCEARVRIVRATPGSGKTWLVAELIRQTLDNWMTRTSGVAALSFTRVGGDEIRKAVGYELGHPHFVGTIDAFLFRYVVRPFLRCCFPGFANPRLIPGEWGAEHWSRYESTQMATISKGINLFGCVFIDEDQDGVVIAYKPHFAQPFQRLEGDDWQRVKDAKKQLWKQSGYLTHSDVALWASKILEHQTLGPTIRAEIVRRFPILIVDELQDTGYFLGKSIRLLLSEPDVRGVLVGDPDQAIFEFNGARPDLFDSFESINGAIVLPLANSRRCPNAVVEVAKHLKDSCGEFCPAEEQKGQAFLIRYNDMKADVNRIVKAVTCGRSTDNVKIIARGNQTIEALVGRSSKSAPKLGCPALNHMHRAVIAFRQGHQVAALAAACAALDIVVFGHEGVSDEKLKENNIDPRAWKMLVVQCLLSVNALTVIGNVFDWQKAVGEVLDAKLAAFDLTHDLGFTPGNIKPQKRSDWDKPLVVYLPQPGVADSTWLLGVPVQTVHSVKGETHDITILVCPTTTRSHCPSVIWWSENARDREEKRIAYVAMTRTQGDLVMCVHEDCFQRLITCQPSFVSSFECKTVDEYEAMWSGDMVSAD